MTPGEITLSSYVYGDTWNGINEIVVTIDGVAPSASLASVEMEFRSKLVPSNVAKLLTSPDDITISDAVNWEISIPAQDLGLTAGVYNWYLQTTDADDIVKTYVQGTIEVLRS